MIRVLIADDHAMVRAGLVELIRVTDDMELVGAAEHGEEAVRLALELQPDVVLMDLSMPMLDGIHAIARIHTALADCRVIALTTFDDPERIDAALRAGASGYLLKDVDPAGLISAIRSAPSGGVPLSPTVAAHVVRGRMDPSANVLTTREEEILRLAADGLANKQIARKLGISEKTVKTHFGHIFDRIGVRDRTQAAVWCVRNLPRLDTNGDTPTLES